MGGSKESSQVELHLAYQKLVYNRKTAIEAKLEIPERQDPYQ